MERSNVRSEGPVDASCEHCGKEVRAIRPAFGWKIAVLATWIVCAVMVMCMAIIGYAAIGVVALAPTVMFLGSFMLSFVHTRAFEPPACPHCERYVRPLGALQPQVKRKSVHAPLQSVTTHG